MRIQLLPNNSEVGKSPYFWLIYLGFFIYPYFIFKKSAYEIALGACITLTFLILNFRGYWLKNRAEFWRNSLMITSLGVIAAPINPGASVFFIYSACFGGGFRLARDGALLIAVNVGAALLTTFAFNLGIYFWLYAVILPIVIGVPTLYFIDISRTRNRLLRQQEEIEHLTKIAERERIARDLHDVLGHTLSMITLKSELARKLIKRDPLAAEREIHEIETTARETLQQVREAISGYRSAGWKFELTQAKKTLGNCGVALHVDAELVTIPAAIENVLCLALRESITNIVRHAAARHCYISLHQTQEHLCCTIEDDGAGEAVIVGNGLRGMRERIEFMGGNLTVDCQPTGIKLTLSLPLSEKEPKKSDDHVNLSKIASVNN